CLGPQTRANVQMLLEETPRLHAAADLPVAIKRLTEAAKVGTERGKAWPDDTTYQIVKEAFESFRKELPERLALFMTEPERPEDAAVVGQRFLRVAGAVA